MTQADSTSTEVTCPTCQKRARWADNPNRPFCSERCKLIDLGAWASGEHAIPGDSVVDAMSTPTDDEFSE